MLFKFGNDLIVGKQNKTGRNALKSSDLSFDYPQKQNMLYPNNPDKEKFSIQRLLVVQFYEQKTKIRKKDII